MRDRFAALLGPQSTAPDLVLNDHDWEELLQQYPEKADVLQKLREAIKNALALKTNYAPQFIPTLEIPLGRVENASTAGILCTCPHPITPGWGTSSWNSGIVFASRISESRGRLRRDFLSDSSRIFDEAVALRQELGYEPGLWEPITLTPEEVIVKIMAGEVKLGRG